MHIHLSPHSTRDVQLEQTEQGFQVIYQGQRGVVIFDKIRVDPSGKAQVGAHPLTSDHRLVIIQRSNGFIFFFNV